MRLAFVNRLRKYAAGFENHPPETSQVPTIVQTKEVTKIVQTVSGYSSCSVSFTAYPRKVLEKNYL
jgi:hypothetical protein